MEKWSSQLLVILSGAILLQLVAFYNGFPLVYSDTGTYIYSGFDSFVPKDRPIFYGLLIKWFSLKKSLWGVVFIQNLLTSFVVFEFSKLIHSKLSAIQYIGITFFLVCLTSIGWYSNQIMPDFFAPLLVLAIVWFLLVRKSHWFKKSLMVFIILAANLSHFSHLFLTSFLVIIISLFYLLCKRKDSLVFFYELKSKLFLLAIITIFSWILVPSIHSFYGGGFRLSKGSHVFLVAHLNEKGILKEILDKHCDTPTLENCSLCNDKNELPKDIDGFIWSGTFLERHGGWDESEEQFSKIIRLSLSSPHLLASNIFYSFVYGFAQLPHIEIGEGLTAYNDHSAPYGQIAWRFPYELNSYLNSKQNNYNGVNLTFDSLNIFHWILQFISIFLILFILANKERIKITKQHIWLIYFLGISILGNSLVTAGLSAPYTRYQSRVMWIIPLLVLLFLFHYRKNIWKVVRTNTE